MNTDEGYVLVASDQHHYLELAVNAACSIRYNDSRSVALLISGGIQVPREYLGIFDYIISFDPEPKLGSMFTRRFFLEKYTPYKRAMHIDADCLLIGSNIDRFWNMFAGMPFGVMAQYQTTGKCYRDQIDVDAIRAAGIADGVYVTNWGVFYYENTGQNPVLAKAREILDLQRSGDFKVKLSYFSRPGEYSDEPIWGIALAELGLKMPSHDYSGLLQLTSPNTSDHSFDFVGRRFKASKGGIRNAQGEIFHFAGMNPLEEYLRAVLFFRSKLGISAPQIVGEPYKTNTESVRMGDDVKSLASRFSSGGTPKFRFTFPESNF